MKPKKWIKKYCKNDYIICDGMTNDMSIPMQIFYIFGVGFGIWIFYSIYNYIHMYKDKKRNKVD